MSNEKPKKKKKESTGEPKAKRNKTPWQARQVLRVERATKALTKLAGTLAGAKAPNVDASLAQNALSAVTTLSVQINMLDKGWKPAKGATGGTSKKIGIGSIVQVKDDLSGDPSAALYTMVDKKLFIAAEVTGEDGETKKGFRYWKVKCTDGVTRVMLKSHAVKHIAPTTNAAAA